MYRSSAVRSTRVLLAALTAAGLAIAGCGSDKDAAPTSKPIAATRPATPTTPTRSTTPTGTTQPAATNSPVSTSTPAATTEPTDGGSAPQGGDAFSAYCTAEMDLNTVANAAGDPDEDPVAFAKALLPSAQAAAALAPASIAPTFTSALAALEAAGDGDGSKMADVGQFSDQINEFDVANCPWTEVPVTMENFHFKGIPATMPAGDYYFPLTNNGDELHVMVILRKKPGVTKSFDELLNDPDGESQTETLIGGGAPPGGSALAIGHLDPGEYLVLCPIPLGSTDPSTEATGPPHFTVGMKETLTVT